jgi:hypothetical protein
MNPRRRALPSAMEHALASRSSLTSRSCKVLCAGSSLRSITQRQQNCHNHMVSGSKGHPAAGVKMTDRGGAMTDISLQKTATTAKRSRGRPFAKGRSGNPAGRPRGSISRSTRAAQLLLDGEATALSRKAVELALAGDPTALRLCLDRTVAPRPLGRTLSAADRQRGGARRGGARDSARPHGPSGGNRARRGFSGLQRRRVCDRPDLACKRRLLLRVTLVRAPSSKNFCRRAALAAAWFRNLAPPA